MQIQQLRRSLGAGSCYLQPAGPSNCWLNIAEGHDDCPGAFAVRFLFTFKLNISTGLAARLCHSVYVISTFILQFSSVHKQSAALLQVYSISAKYHSIKQKLKGNQYIQIDTDRFSGILDELTTWLHSSPAVRKQSAEHWADKHGTLGDEHAIADHLGAAQQSTATIREPAQRTSKIELLRQRHDSNAAEHWQDGECTATDNHI